MCEIVGVETASHLRDLTLRVYKKAAGYARQRGVIIADTKFEFGRTEHGITLADEVLTPDSSRFWPADKYQPGRAQDSYDKQYVRDYLEQIHWNKQPPLRHYLRMWRGARARNIRKRTTSLPGQAGSLTAGLADPAGKPMTIADWMICAVVLLNVVAAAMQGFFSEALSMAGLIVGYVVAAWQYRRLENGSRVF